MALDLSGFYQKSKNLKDSQKVTEEQLIRKEVIDEKVALVKEYIYRKHGVLKILSLTDQDKRKELEEVVTSKVQDYEELTPEEKKQVIQNTVGFGVIEDILDQDESVTDIRYNGSQVVVETPTKKYLYGKPVTDQEIESLITRFANAGNAQFNNGNPILDVQIGNIRLNAVHSSNAPYGTTMALRINKFKQIYTKDYFPIAPDSIRKMLHGFVSSHLSVFIVGETGSSKTELQKYIIEPIPFDEAIFLIEEIPETHLKELYPDKDIASVAEQGGKATISDLLKASKRNNSTWVLLTEVRSHEAYQLIEILKSDHKVVATFHARSVEALPYVLTGMIAEHYPINEESYVQQVYENLDIGIQLSKRKIDGVTIRYIKEICEYTSEGVRMIFTQRLNHEGKLIPKYYPLSTSLIETLEDYGQENAVSDFNMEADKMQ